MFSLANTFVVDGHTIAGAILYLVFLPNILRVLTVFLLNYFILLWFILFLITLTYCSCLAVCNYSPWFLHFHHPLLSLLIVRHNVHFVHLVFVVWEILLVVIMSW
jgi:hypothetical protein